MSDNDAKAKALADEGDKMLNSSGILGMFSKKNRVEDAVERFRKAANLYKLAKNWTKAAECFYKCALNQERSTEAATYYLDAASCFRKCSASDAAGCYEKAIEIYKDMGRFSMVAKYYQLIGEVYEEYGNLEEALKYFDEAADFYNTEGATSTANKCTLKVATFAALTGDYEKATKYYEEVAKCVLKSPLLKYSAKEHYFRALICALCISAETASNRREAYLKEYPPLEDCREFRLFVTLMECLDENKVDEFTDAIQEYDKISRLDDWYTKMFLKIKNSFTSEFC